MSDQPIDTPSVLERSVASLWAACDAFQRNGVPAALTQSSLTSSFWLTCYEDDGKFGDN